MLALKSYVDNVVNQVDTLCDVRRPDPTEEQLHGFVKAVCKQLHELSDKAPSNIQSVVANSFDGHWDYAKNVPLAAEIPKDGKKAPPKIDALQTQVIFKVVQEGLKRIQEKADYNESQGKTQNRNDEIEVYSLPYEQEKQVGRLFQDSSYYLKQIQRWSDTWLEVDGVDITIKGPKEGIVTAKTMINDITTKGFSALLMHDDFVESSIEVNSAALPEIIGQRWKNIKAIKEKFNVEVGDLEERGERRKKENRPDAGPTNTLSAGNEAAAMKPLTKVPILIGGRKEDIEAAKEVFRELEEFYHSEVTHPGEVHKFVEAAKEDFGKIIGARGSAIRHMQNHYKVRVYVPSKDRAGDHEKVLIIGQPEAVEEAVKHAEKLAAEKAPEREENWGSGDWEDY